MKQKKPTKEEIKKMVIAKKKAMQELIKKG